MTTANELRALLERVEKMAGPDYQMHDEIASALYTEKRFAQLADAPEGVGCWMYRNGDGAPWQSALSVTASLDAVIGAIKDLMPPTYLFSISRPANWSGRKGRPRFEATVSNNSEIGTKGHVFAQTEGATPELALLAALLRAKLAQEDGNA